MRVDAHLHFFSRPFFEALARLSPLPGAASEKLEAVARRAGLEVPGADLDRHRERWLAQLSANGIDHAAIFASLPEEAPAVAAAIAAAPTRLSGLCLLNPCAEGAAARVRSLLGEHGFKGVLLFPAMHHFRIHGPECKPVLSVLGEQQGLAVVHCGLLQVKLRDLLGLPRPYDLGFANPLDLVPAANAHPTVTFVIPHFGAGFLREALMAGAQCENIYVDTSSSNSWMATQASPMGLPGVLERALGVFGPERILFGTDSSTFPRGWRADLHANLIAAMDELGLPDTDRARILGDNAARILRL